MVKINNVAYNEIQFQDSKFKCTEFWNGTIVLEPISTKLDLYYGELIYIGKYSKYFMIDTFSISTIRFKPTKMYKHTIVFIECTKLLQDIPLSNRSITQPIRNEKRNLGLELQKKLVSVADSGEINLYCNLYNLMTIPAPEMQWNRPTLYEMILDIFAQMDWIPVVEYDSINSRFELTKRDQENTGVQLDDTYFVGDEFNNGSKNYATALDIELENASSNSENAIQTSVSFRSESGVVNDSNLDLILEHSIYYVNFLYAKNFVLQYQVYNLNEPGTTWFEYVNTVDLTDVVVSEETYNTLEDNANAPGSLKKSSYLYFKGNKICGSNLFENIFFTDTDGALIKIIKKKALNIVKDKYSNEFHISLWDSSGLTLRNVMFDVDYQTLDSMKIKVKNNITRNKVTLIDNQSDSYINLDAFAKVKQDNIDYLGNEIRTIYANYKDSETQYIADIGDEYEGYIIYERRVSTFSTGKTNVVYLASKNYPKLNRSMVLNQKKRYTQFASTNDSFSRNETIDIGNFYLTESTPLVDYSVCDYLLAFNGNHSKAHYHVALNSFLNGTISKYYIMNTMNNIVGRSIVLTSRMASNIGVGIQIYDTSVSGGYGERMVRYVDDNGEFASIRIYLCCEQYPTTFSESIKYPEKNIQSAPSSSQYVQQITRTINKDNRERMVYSIQMNFKNTNDFEIGDGFLKNTGFIKERKMDSVGAYYWDTTTMSVMRGNAVDTNASITKSNNHFDLSGLTIGATDYKVVDQNGLLIFKINKAITSTTMTIYLNKE